jgi:2-phospho-L-lactate/phosphoenolpyruvate guanylyltransferase
VQRQGIYSARVTVTAIIPLKALSAAKGRLADAMSPVDRRAFTIWMANRVITACRATPAIEDILVVAGDEDAANVGRDAGVRVIVVTEPGLDIALHAADEVTAQSAVTIIVAADLPQLTPTDLSAVVAAAAGTDPVVVVAPTHDGGTGALLRRPAGVISPAYGPGSAAAHEALAHAASARVAIVRREGLAADVDTPAHLPAALAQAAMQDVGSPPPT